MTFRKIIIEAMRRAGADAETVKALSSKRPLDPALLDREMEFKPGFTDEQLISEFYSIFSNQRKLDSFISWLERELDSVNKRN